MKKVLLKIGGMTCSACSNGLEKYLNKQDGVERANVNLVMNNASIEYDDKKLSLKDIEKFVDKAGFESLGIDNLKKEERKKSGEKINLILTSIFSIPRFISFLTLFEAFSKINGVSFIIYHHPVSFSQSQLVQYLTNNGFSPFIFHIFPSFIASKFGSSCGAVVGITA